MSITDNISYKLAMELKSIGFNHPCTSFYTKEDAPDDQVWLSTADAENYNDVSFDCPFYVPVCSAPSYHLVLEWLREKYQMHCFAVVDDDVEEGETEIWHGANQWVNGGLSLPIPGHWKSWTEAIESAISHAIPIVRNLAMERKP